MQTPYYLGPPKLVTQASMLSLGDNDSGRNPASKDKEQNGLLSVSDARRQRFTNKHLISHRSLSFYSDLNYSKRTGGKK